MNDNKLFNSPFEMELRTILLLSVGGKADFTVDRIVALDFITCYAAEFNMPYANLHGQNNYKFGEISNRRFLAKEAVKNLVIKGLVQVRIDHGYLFSISDDGKKYAKKFVSAYAKDYREIAKAVVKKYKNESDVNILGMIQEFSIRSLKR